MPVACARFLPELARGTPRCAVPRVRRGDSPTAGDLRSAVKHYLAGARAPRVTRERVSRSGFRLVTRDPVPDRCTAHPPGTSLRRAVVETYGATWIALARGTLTFRAAVRDGRFGVGEIDFSESLFRSPDHCRRIAGNSRWTEAEVW